jgi:hypothetical protein
MKCQIDQLSSTQNVKLMKSQVDKMSSWQTVKLANCQVDEMSSWQNIKLMKCQVDEMMYHLFSSIKLLQILPTKSAFSLENIFSLHH